jgi:glycosyltransferase involved in cell wall biosynthesis
MQRTAVRWASAFCFRRATAIIAVSNQLKAHLARTWQIPAEKIIVLPNGADVNKFHPDASQKEARLRLGLNDAPTAVFVGGFYPWHAPLHLIEAFAQTSQSLPEAQLCLVGNGPMRAQTEARARELGLDGVIFAGAVSHEQIPDWLTAADIALAPYAPLERELWFSPLKLFEYMAAGKAIVASDMGQVAEVIQDGHNGILIPVGDVAGFAAAMAELLTDKGKRDQLGQHARQQAISRHSWQYYAVQLAALYVQARQALA